MQRKKLPIGIQTFTRIREDDPASAQPGGAQRSSSWSALQQLRNRGYADQYRSRGEPIHPIGVEFSRDNRSVVGFETDTL